MTSKEVIAIQRLEIAQLKTKVENLEKVIEILKDKWIDVGMVIHLIQCDNDTPEYYNEGLEKQYRLTQEQYDLLKEWLDD